MTGLFRTRQPFLQTNAWQNQALNALHYNTSQQGSVVPLVYGTVRQQINLLDFQDYKGPVGAKGKTGSLPITGTQSRSAKGGSSKSGKKSSPDYSLDVMFGLCQGPITGIGNVYTSAGIANFGSLPLNFYSGADGQAADTTFVRFGSIVGYSGTATVSATPLDLGPSPVLPNIAVEIIGLEVGINTGSFTSDANPANVITDFLTNSRYGVGFPSGNLSDLTTLTGTSFAEYCQATPLLISTSLDGHQKAIEWLDAIAKLCNTAMFFAGKLLYFVPFGDLSLNNNSATWTPNLVPEYSLTDYHFIPWRQHELGREPQPGEDDPLLVTRTNSADANNWKSIEYTDRDNFYNSTTLTVDDQGLIDAYGLRMGDSIQGRAFCSVIPAQVSVQLNIQRDAYIRNTPYKLQIGWQFARLTPMDIITLTGRHGDLYLNEQPVRILSIEEDDQGGLTIEAEEIQQGVSLPPVVPGPPPNVIAYGASPSNYSANFLVRTADLTINSPYPISSGAAKENAFIMMVETRDDILGPVAPVVSSITSIPPLTWQKRTDFSGTTLPGPVGSNMEIWWADCSSLASGTLVTPTVHFSGVAYLPQFIMQAVANVGNPASPWDTNASLPHKVSGNSVPPQISGVSTTKSNTVTFVWMTSPHFMTNVGTNGGMTVGSPPFIVSPLSTVIGSSVLEVDTWANCYVVFNSPQSSLLLKPFTPDVNSVVGPYPTVGYLMIADAIVGA